MRECPYFGQVVGEPLMVLPADTSGPIEFANWQWQSRLLALQPDGTVRLVEPERILAIGGK